MTPLRTSSPTPPSHPQASLHRPTLRVDCDRGVARLTASWPAHPPAHVMRHWQHQLAAFVWSRSGGMGWDVSIGAGADRGGVPCVWVDVDVGDGRYALLRAAERVLDDVRALVALNANSVPA